MFVLVLVTILSVAEIKKKSSQFVLLTFVFVSVLITILTIAEKQKSTRYVFVSVLITTLTDADKKFYE